MPAITVMPRSAAKAITKAGALMALRTPRSSGFDPDAGRSRSQLSAEHLASPAQARHDGADGYAERVLDFLVAEFVHVGQEHYLGVLARDVSAGGQYFLVG